MPAPAAGQVNGYASVMFDALPRVEADDPCPAGGECRSSIVELRARVLAERAFTIRDQLRFRVGGYVDGLIADRTVFGAARAASDAVARPLDLYGEYVSDRLELRAGLSRVVWGKLDEFQPTDVVNPLDVTRFLLEGRSEARLPVPLVRARLFVADWTIESLVVPTFTEGRFDQLHEWSSPFNVARARIPVREKDGPDGFLARWQGGARVSTTTGRVDWAATAYRGLRAFPLFDLEASQGEPFVVESHPRFTMIGGDLETTWGPWGLRAEAAAFVEDRVQATELPRAVAGRSLEWGVGGDRRAGDYRLSANVRLAHRRVDNPLVSPRERGELQRTDMLLVAAADRSFVRETRTLRAFAAYDPVDDTVFARVIGAISVRENVWVEGSAGLFAGASNDTIGRLTTRDFLYARLKVFF